MIATFVGGQAHVQKVMTSQYIKAIQLSDSVFLLQASQHPKDRSLWKQVHYLLDFRTGDQVLLGTSQSREKLVHFSCLLSVPERNEAVIIRYGQGTDRTTLMHVDLRTLATTARYTIPRTDATRGFHGGPHMKLSPDFRLIAAMSPYEPPEQQRAPRRSYSWLRVLDLETMNTVELDDEVMVEISAFSSHGYGTPPFEWTTAGDILYQDMIPEDVNEGRFRREADYVLKCANVKTRKVTEWVRRRLPMTPDGGSMQRDWFTGELRYQNFTVDERGHSLIPYRPCYSVKVGCGSVEIRFRDQVLHQHKGGFSSYGQGCISHSRQHFAYFVRFVDGARRPTVFAKTADMREPLVVAEVPFYTTLVTWIEDTSHLRDEKSKNCTDAPH